MGRSPIPDLGSLSSSTICKIACNVSAIGEDVKAALHNFDKALPHLTRLRNIGEHINEYAVESDSRHDKKVVGKELQVGKWDGTVYEWLDIQLNVHDALNAAEELYIALQTARKGMIVRSATASSRPDGGVSR